MIETKELTKVYSSKGNKVIALNKINLKLPDTGMVFILGKSGSGKSTLLNVLGGLDGFDSGEIIFKGKSTKTFKQADFDSYRNTYIGFIFQEYNILEDFTVAANIGLAIELQGRKVSNEEVNNILDQMELTGLGGRKPNELSGGQLQRVAIARALVKNPQIIMADEPTGALDSATSTQIFEVLKKLSKEKLVLIISHDREFSELYADRIIELKDGNIISDVTVDPEFTHEHEIENVTYDNGSITVKENYQLTKEDLDNINKYLREVKKDITITSKKINKKSNKVFVETNQDDVMMSQEGYKLIKSSLSAKNSFKIGSSSLKHKPFKLAVAIFLSVVAFILFGLSDTIASYNERKTAINSMLNTNINYATFVSENVEYDAEDKETYYRTDKQFLTKANLNTLNSRYGKETIGIIGSNFYISYGNNSSTDFNTIDIRPSINGMVKINQNIVNDFGFTLKAGHLPTNNSEGLISEFIYKALEKNGYYYNDSNYNQTLQKVSSYNDVVDKLELNGIKIVGILDTNLDFGGYFDTINFESAADLIKYSFINSNLTYGPHALMFVNESYYESNINENTQFNFAMAPMNGREDIVKAYDVSDNTISTTINSTTYTYRFVIKNEVTDQLKTVTSGLKVLGRVFGYVSLFFAFFAILTLSNYIATSINYKKRDIGILRAIGSRGHDVFKIFFAESIVIAAINYVLSSIGTILISISINNGLKNDAGFKVTILNYGIRQIALMLVVVLFVAVIATALPVRKISRKKPIDAIRNR